MHFVMQMHFAMPAVQQALRHPREVSVFGHAYSPCLYAHTCSRSVAINSCNELTTCYCFAAASGGAPGGPARRSGTATADVLHVRQPRHRAVQHPGAGRSVQHAPDGARRAGCASACHSSSCFVTRRQAITPEEQQVSGLCCMAWGMWHVWQQYLRHSASPGNYIILSSACTLPLAHQALVVLATSAMRNKRVFEKCHLTW